MRVQGVVAVFAAGLWLGASLGASAQGIGAPDLAPPTPRITTWCGPLNRGVIHAESRTAKSF